MSKNRIPEYVQVSVKAPALTYINEFMRLKCAGDLLAAKIFGSAKEVSEAMGVYAAIRRNLRSLRFDDPTVTALVREEGSVPRIGALLAYRTSWNVVSIGQNLKDRAWRIHRLTVIPAGLTEAIAALPRLDKVLIVTVGDIGAMILGTLALPDARVSGVALTNDGVDTGPLSWPDVVQEDMAIWSGNRTVSTWQRVGFVHGQQRGQAPVIVSTGK